MKKLFYLLIFTISIQSFNAQESSDAMRYSLENLNGTARFRAMGGAFGALGGDFSSLTVNPAGSAVFSNNQAAITLSSFNLRNRTNYFGGKESVSDNSIDLNQAGGIWVFDNYDEKTGWNKITLALNYENTSSFDNSVFARGNNPTTSITDYFVNHANGIPSGVANDSFAFLNYDEQQAYLGLNGELISPIGNSSQYQSNLSATGNYYQENSISTTGYNGKLIFNAGASYKDRFYFGINLNSHFVDYVRNTSFYEDYLTADNNDATKGVQALRFSNDLYTYGTGFSFQLGAIAKVTNEFRVGLSYESPTWYSLNDELLQTLAIDCADCGGQNSFFVDPNVTMVYPTYKLRTPGKYNGSLAYVFGKRGLISFDYSYKDYSNSEFKPKGDYSIANNEISDSFKASSEFRIGGEYRIQEWSLRGGYRFQESPYKDGKTIGDLNSYSAGLGYSFGDVKLDVSYTLAKRDYMQGFFSRGLTSQATINSRNDNVSLTVLFEL